MVKKRKQYSNEFKFKVALEAIKGVKTISQLAMELEWLKKKSAPFN